MRKSFGPKPCPTERMAANDPESKLQPDIITSEDG